MSLTEQPAAPATLPPNSYQAAMERVRGAIRWLLTALAAVGAVLIAGLSVSDIGAATGSRLAWAVASYAFAIGGVLAACAAAVWVIGLSVYARSTWS